MSGLSAISSESSFASPRLASKAEDSDVARFYAGTLLSSIGSITFTICLTAFMLKSGQALTLIGITIAANRLVPLFVNLLWGDISDRIDPRRIILLTEAAASLLSVGLYVSWGQGDTSFWIFLAILVLRSSVVALQAGARARIVKTFGKDSFESNSRAAVWLNKATHGAAIFGGSIGWLFVRYGTFHHVIIFDLLTFALAGAFLWTTNISISTATITNSYVRVFKKFGDLYRYAAIPAVLDLLLAVSTCGMGTLVVRLSSGNQELVPLFLFTFGAAVWASGYLCRLPFIKNRHRSIWLILAGSFVAAFSSIGSPALVLPLIFIRDLAYWILYHRYTAQIHYATPAHSIAGVTSARTIQVVIVLSLGEIGVGYWGSHVSNLGESGWRALLCVVIASAISIYRIWSLRQTHRI